MERTWAADVEITDELVKQLIESQFPELGSCSIERIGSGWDNVVFGVNHQLIFRFPRRTVAAPLIETEARLLPWLAPRVPLPVPHPCHTGTPALGFPWMFVGYPRLAGDIVPPLALSLDARARYLEALGGFLAVLHRLPLAEARRHGAPEDMLERTDHRRRRRATGERLDHLATCGLLTSREPLDEILDASPVYEPEACSLVHGDLHVGQLLGNADGLTAVIDWGDVHVGDPAVDLAIVHALAPPSLHPVFLRAYGPVSLARWQAARARAVWHTIALLVSAADTEDEGMVVEALTELEYLRGPS